MLNRCLSARAMKQTSEYSPRRLGGVFFFLGIGNDGFEVFGEVQRLRSAELPNWKSELQRHPSTSRRAGSGSTKERVLCQPDDWDRAPCLVCEVWMGSGQGFSPRDDVLMS